MGTNLANIPIFVAHILIQVYILLNYSVREGLGVLQQHINDHPFFGQKI